MLIEFRASNFLSYRDEVVLSMVADKNRELAETNTFKQGNLTLLKTATIFGANASGKTNLITAMFFLNQLFRTKTDLDALFANLPTFKLDTYSDENPIGFELSFFLNGQRHRYGIELDHQGICEEWLYFVPNRTEACYFVRDRNGILTTGSYFGDKKALDFIKPDRRRPFIFTLGQDSIKQFEWAKQILIYLSSHMKPIQSDTAYTALIQEQLVDQKPDSFLQKEELVSLLKAADIGVTNISVAKEKRTQEEIEFLNRLGTLLENTREIEDVKYETYMHHHKYDDSNQLAGEEQFPLDMESRGTVKLYNLQYPILQALKYGGILLVDEIDSSLHPLVCERIIQMFNSSVHNPKHAQLICTTHNTLLMNPALLRRDQIFFTEKNKYGVSSLYSLYDIDLDIRNNFNYLNNYLAGRFGAVPYLGSFELAVKSQEVDINER
ncbi:AAA family ATPase [Paenibacillus sp. 1P07SE]|uniref:AAA family ATPase n=1 Tax=Paenibacillus sp. 1P07SE TaxID=3132209 RepID=UPI0039A6B5AD